MRQDYECLDCSEIFEGWEENARCPDCGGSNLEIVFITPRGTASIRTQNADAVARDLVYSSGKTDFNNNPNTNHAPDNPVNFQTFSAKNQQEFNANINAAINSKMLSTLKSIPGYTGQIKPISDMRDVPTAGDTIRQLKQNRIHPREMMNVIAAVDKSGRQVKVGRK